MQAYALCRTAVYVAKGFEQRIQELTARRYISKPYSRKGGTEGGGGLATLTSATSQEIVMHVYVTTKLLLHMKYKLFMIMTMTTRYRENKTGNVRIT